MKNSELLSYNPDRLTGLEKQRAFLVREFSQQRPCPNCGTPHNVFEAIGIAVDDYDFLKLNDKKGSCRKCGRTLKYVLPIIGGWFWRLEYAEAKKVDSVVNDVRAQNGLGPLD